MSSSVFVVLLFNCWCCCCWYCVLSRFVPFEQQQQHQFHVMVKLKPFDLFSVRFGSCQSVALIVWVVPNDWVIGGLIDRLKTVCMGINWLINLAFFFVQGTNISQLERDIGSDQFPPNEHYFGLVNVSAKATTVTSSFDPSNFNSIIHDISIFHICFFLFILFDSLVIRATVIPCYRRYISVNHSERRCSNTKQRINEPKKRYCHV